MQARAAGCASTNLTIPTTETHDSDAVAQQQEPSSKTAYIFGKIG
jgi:hypothetical protein